MEEQSRPVKASGRRHRLTPDTAICPGLIKFMIGDVGRVWPILDRHEFQLHAKSIPKINF